MLLVTLHYIVERLIYNHTVGWQFDTDALYRLNKQQWPKERVLHYGDIAQSLCKKGLRVMNNATGRLFLKASRKASAF